MLDYELHKSQIEEVGFAVIKNIFSIEQIQEILQLLNQLDTSRKKFRKSADLFAIRQFFNEAPEIYTNWTVKQDQFSVQPPLDILKQTYTVRIHLDHTDGNNGALKVIPSSHSKDVLKLSSVDLLKQMEHICEVPEGGVMIMKPLLLHSSCRTTNNQKRRVIHIEFCNKELHHELQWTERKDFRQRP
jgi:ectoine hydroxylase-related dioxygenase (phytanoyl-CoA dioxygenase family)